MTKVCGQGVSHVCMQVLQICIRLTEIGAVSRKRHYIEKERGDFCGQRKGDNQK